MDKSIKELKDSLDDLLRQISFYSAVLYDEEFAVYVEEEIQVLESLENISDFDERSKQFKFVKGAAEKPIRNFIGKMVVIANNMLSKGREIVSKSEETSRSCENIKWLSEKKCLLKNDLKWLESSLSVHNNAKSLSEEVNSFWKVYMWMANVKLALGNIETRLKFDE